MGGQTPSTECELASSDISSDVELEIDAENLDIVEPIVDPLADFIEKHGYKLVRNHEGEYVTVAEAIENCPPFRRLVLAMGEGALALMATQKPEENEDDTNEVEDKSEEIELGTEDNHVLAKKEAILTEAEIAKKDKPVNTETSLTETEMSDQSRPEVNITENTREFFNHEVPDSGTMPINLTVTSQTPKTEVPSAAAPMNTAPTEVPKVIKTSQTGTKARNPVPTESAPLAKIELPPTPGGIIKDKRPILGEDIPSSTAQEVETGDTVFSPRGSVTDTEEPERVVIMSKEQGYEESEIDNVLDNSDTSRSETLDQLARGDLYQPPETVDSMSLLSEKEYIKNPEKKIDKLFDFLQAAEWSEDEEIIIIAAHSEVSATPELESLRPGYEPKAAHFEIEAELPVPVSVREQATGDITAKIEALEPEGNPTVPKFLKAIAIKTQQAQNLLEGDFRLQGAQKDLEKLVVELFDCLKVEHRPETIKSIVHEAIKGDVSSIISALDNIDKEPTNTTDRGTHEYIKQKLSSITVGKKGFQYAYHIGRSALRLWIARLAKSMA